MITRWPTREEWARDQRDPCSQDHEFDWHSDGYPSDQLASYATPAEAAAAIAELRQAWLAKGREMRALDRRKTPAYLELRRQRRSFNAAIADLRQGMLPRMTTDMRISLDAVRLPIIETLRQRYITAYERGHAAWKQRIEQTPIDDAAWQAELERRREFNARFPLHDFGNVTGEP